MNILKDKRIVLGISGGIAAYKSATLASRLVQAGALVDVVMTESAQKFISALTFQSLTHRQVHSDIFHLPPHKNIPHIDLSHNIDALLIAPATANTLAKMANGIADNLLTAIALATDKPILIAPAMEGDMWTHPATQRNMAQLRQWGISKIGPAEGRLASGRMGHGRMSEPDEIVDALKWMLAKTGDMAGKKVVISAGGTQEALDPVRFLGNYSTGRMGHALAEAARNRGAHVTLVTTAALPVPMGVSPVRVTSAAEMRDAVLSAIKGTDALVMAAAVADYRPTEIQSHKIKKSDDNFSLNLTRTDDILKLVAAHRQQSGFPKYVVGFSAETDNMLKNAEAKLKRKSLNWIAANDVTQADAGFGVETNRVTLIGAGGERIKLPLLSKLEVAHKIWDALFTKSATI